MTDGPKIVIKGGNPTINLGGPGSGDPVDAADDAGSVKTDTADKGGQTGKAAADTSGKAGKVAADAEDKPIKGVPGL